MSTVEVHADALDFLGADREPGCVLARSVLTRHTPVAAWGQVHCYCDYCKSNWPCPDAQFALKFIEDIK